MSSRLQDEREASRPERSPRGQSPRRLEPGPLEVLAVTRHEDRGGTGETVVTVTGELYVVRAGVDASVQVGKPFVVNLMTDRVY